MVLIILTHAINYGFCSFTSFDCIYGKCLFLSFLLSTGYFHLLYLLWLGRLLCYPPQKIFLVPPRPVTCLLVLLLLFISSYYLGYCSFSLSYGHSGNWHCTKRFLLIVCIVMLQNYYDGKIVKLHISERLFVEKMHQKKANIETLCKIWFIPFVPWLQLRSISNHDGKWVLYDFHIHIYIYTLFIYILYTYI